MKRRFTKILAALALLLFVAPPMMGWGQTTYTMTLDNNADGNNNVHWLTLNTTLTYQDVSWTTNVTPSNCYIGTSKSFAQVGSKNNPATQITISTDDFAGKTITGVSLTGYCTNNTGPTLTITAGNTTILNAVPLVKTTSTTYSPQSMQAVQLGQNEALSFIFNSSASAGICMSEITVTYITGSSATATNTTITVPTNFNTDVYTSTTAGQLTATVTYDNNGTPTNVPGATVTWASTNTGVATVDANGNVTLVAAGTTNITATFAGNDDYATSYDTYELTVTNNDPNLPGTANNPYTAAAIIAMGSSLPSGTVYVSGIVSSFFGDNILDDGNNYRYYISEDGVEEDEIRVYKGKGLNNQQFANVDDVLIGDHVIICGELSVYNDMVQFNANNFIVSLTRPDSYTLTVSSLSHAEMFVFAGNSSEMLFEGVGSGSVIEGASVVLSVEPEYGYELSSLMVDGEEHVNDINSGAYVFNMPSHDVEVTVATTRLAYYTVTFKTNGVLETTMDIVQGDHISDAGTLPTVTNDYIPAGYEFMGWYAGDYAVSNTAPATYITDAFEPQGNVTVNAVFAEVVTPGTPDTWTKITDLSTVTAGVYALIDADGYAFNGSMSSGHGQHTDATFSFTNNVATSAPTGTCELTLTASGNGFTMYNSAKGFLYASKAGSGGLAWHSSEDNYWYYDEVNDQDNWIYSKSYNGSNAMLRVYDHTFRTYAANNNNPVYMAKKTAGAPAEYGNYRTSLTETSNPLVITGYGQNAGGYYLIASPVYVSPSSVTNMLANSYDLYYFDQNNDLEWRNYKQNAFNLEPGKGYLYANSNTVSLTFTGTAYNGTGEITLTQGSGKWANWNLIGNPWTNDAILQDGNGTNANNVAYYTMNQDGDELAAGTTGATIAAMNGVFVEAATDGQVVYFNEVASAPGGEDVTPQVSLNITKNRGCLIDRAIVRFDEGGVLHKFQLNPNNTKIYITEVNQDYAVVRGANEGELPVNFKAKENGTYTLSVNIENVEMNYLHLIDNMTGADIDLLQTPSYTFDANVNDYESRFRLVFSANNGSNDNGNETFAYYNGSEWMINNIGDATLQVVDVMGRILSSETISGSCSKAINATTGVYMLRLINGENVKVQKVVVR